MFLIGVIANQKQIEQVRKEIEDLKVEIVAINPNCIENVKNIKFDITIVYDTIEMFKDKEKYVKSILSNSKYLLLNADANIENEILKGINVKMITYGLNQKSTITASSIGENEIIICIQRAFRDIDDNIVEQKEVRSKLEKNNIKNIYNSLIKVAIINILAGKNG